MKIAVRFRWKSGVYSPLILSSFEIIRDDIAYKMRGGAISRGRRLSSAILCGSDFH